MTERAHARLAPSSSFRWLSCAGSVALIEAIGEDRRTEAAAEGTVAHQIRSECLEIGFEPYDFVGHRISADGFTFTVDQGMCDMLQPGIDRLREVAGSTLHVEYRVDLGEWLPGQFGTLDAGWWSEDVIGIDDLKFGRIAVSPVENDQLRIYALGFWQNVARHHTNATRFEIHIDQPRSIGGGGLWYVTLDELQEFGAKVAEAGRATQFKDAPRTPSAKACAYCPGAEYGRCPEYVQHNLEMWNATFDEIDEDVPPVFPPLPTITPERRRYLVENMRQVKAWFDHLAEWELRDGIAGLPTPGRKPVLGRPVYRRWFNPVLAEKKVVEILGDRAFTRKLKSSTQVDKEVPKDLRPAIKALVTRAPGRPTMVPLDDERPAIASAQSTFDEVEEGTDG